jgi:hypothetical protein
MKKLYLENITLVCMTSVLIPESIKALQFSSKDIEFEKIKFISDKKPQNLPKDFIFEETSPINNIDDWNHRVVFELGDYIDTDFIVLIHDDGFIVNSKSWREEFLKYDYIGAPWDHKHLFDEFGNIVRVGNSVSLRSKKLLSIPKQHSMPWIKHDGNFNEDTQICVWNRKLFTDNGIKFAPLDVAKYFSHETYIEELEGIEPFCFHNFSGRNIIYKNIIDNYKP